MITKFSDKLFLNSEERIRTVKKMFAQIAPRYDLMNRLMSWGLDIVWRRTAIRSAQFQPGSRILDLGTGSGDMAAELSQKIADCTIFAYDNCPELLIIGRNRKEFQKFSNPVHWLIGDGRFLPFREKSFDGIVAAFSIRNMPDLPLVFHELYRATVPNGKIVILDMVQPTPKFYQFLFKFYFKWIVPIWGKFLGSHSEAYRYLYPSIKNFYSEKKIVEALKEIGCKQVISKKFIFQMVTLCIGIK
ncbi:ubiquinone/menaquinone biosynthesis methyltransferase [candidate division KSB1 bacterium]|nr:ubiquinone/menaquinone biosynthesis methyltransferase [candidate division KSB1 bacterium]